MVTRIHCDHCGNVISNRQPNVFSFGPLRPMLREAYNVQQGMQALSQNRIFGPTQSQALQPHEVTQVEDVDLCNTCVPIWMSRVRNLTKASDPE